MSKSKIIRYAEKIENTQVLGPGKRAVLWVHGCCFSCKGCIAQNFRTGDYQTADIKELVEWYLKTDAQGLTISGGEPMLQADALACMIKEIRKEKDMGVIVYTGFLYEDLLKKTQDGIESFLKEIDILIDGPYIEEKDTNEPYKGSENQRILQLTSRYKEEVDAYYNNALGRKIEIKISGSKTLLVGVPAKEQALIWNQVKSLSKINEIGDTYGESSRV